MSRERSRTGRSEKVKRKNILILLSIAFLLSLFRDRPGEGRAVACIQTGSAGRLSIHLPHRQERPPTGLAAALAQAASPLFQPRIKKRICDLRLSIVDLKIEFATEKINYEGTMSNPITLQLGGEIWTLAEIEDKMITIALAKAKGNREEAAKLLGIPVRSLWRKIASRIKKG